MVSQQSQHPSDPPSSWAQRIWQTIQHDAQAWLMSLSPPSPPDPGIYTYRLLPEGGQQRIHLRIEQDGSGVLFVDVNDVIHLNTTATEMTRLALDEMPQEQARAMLHRRFRNVSREQLSRELGGIYKMVDRLRTPGDHCPTCAIATLSNTQRPPIFSTPVQAPYKADLALSYGCNNACPHCYNEQDRITLPSLDKQAWQQVIDHLHAIGIPHLIFTGGEATLHPALPALIHHADQRGAITGLNTNGRRLANADYVQTLVEAGLNHVQITLGSCKPDIHNAMTGAASFDQTVQGIEQSVSSKLHTITNTTLTRRNSGHVEEIITFLHALGIRTFAMNAMICSGGGLSSADTIAHEDLAPLLVRVREHASTLGMRFLWYTPTEYCRLSPVELEIGTLRCNAGEYTICIEPDGSVLPCQSYYVPAGHILRDPWEQIWNSALFRQFRERNHNPQSAGLPEECWHCPDLSLCGGGCPLEREASTLHEISECQA